MSFTPLNQLKCSACNGNTPKLKEDQVINNLKFLNNWSLNEEKEMIFKKFIFQNFNKSINFANLVGKIADAEGHHPDISLGWGYCLIMIHTHAIKGLSINDFILASKIDNINI